MNLNLNTLTVALRKSTAWALASLGLAVCGSSDWSLAQVPATPCGSPGCAWRFVQRVAASSDPCGAMACGSPTCSGVSPECGDCTPGPCIAVWGNIAPASTGHLWCAQAPTASCGGTDGSGRFRVVVHQYQCKLGVTGCVCRDDASFVVIPCPCSTPSATQIQVCY